MTLKFVTIPAVVLAASALASTPAFAQRRGGTPHESHQSASHAAAQAQPRQQAPRAQAAPRVYGGGVAVPRAEMTPRYNGSRVYGGGVAVPRVAPRYNGYYNGYYNHNYYYGGRYYPGPWHGWYGYAPFSPYYFRPWYSIGFGISLGYPVPYYAYPYQVPVYGYGAPYGDVSVGPNNNAYGGVALEITPNDAAVYVDGTYAGIVSDFDGSRQPLTLVPGTHHIEIDQNGFEPLTFDVTVQPGMVTPYQGALRPL